MNHRITIILSLFLLFAASCSTTKKINKAIEPKELTPALVNKDVEDSIKRVKDNFKTFASRQIDFKTFSAKIKVESVGGDGKVPDLTVVLKMVKDSAIWMSLSATILNVEVYRVLITSDSVVLLNKQDKEVQFRSIGYLQEVTQIPFDFKTLQNLIIGNPIFISDSVISYRHQNNNVLMTTIDAYFKNLLTLTPDHTTLLHSKLDDIDLLRSRTADITYDGYETISGFPFSTSREITASEKNKLDIRLNFKQYEFNKDLNITFNIPKNYLRK